MATTTAREDYLGRDLINPTVNALDYLGRAVGGAEYIVTVTGTTAASEPTPPARGATVADGTATLLRQK